MVAPSNKTEGQRPSDELGPRLRDAVERVIDDPVPDELMRRTLDRVRQQPPTVARVSKRPIRLDLVIAVATAASLAGVALWMTSELRSKGPAEIAEAPTIDQSMEARPESVDESSPTPTMWAYHQILREDPESLDDLLEAHAGRLGNADPESLRMGVSLSNEGATSKS
jgi:hypothetical protein